MVKIINADVFDGLAGLPDDSVHCVVASPPYWGLRDYGVDGQIGLEPTLGEHIDVMVRVFAEIWRVLRKDGTVWLNYGDCYATSPNGRSAAGTKAIGDDDRTFRDKPFSTVGPIYDPAASGGPRGGKNAACAGAAMPLGRVVAGGTLKAKDLCMVSFRLFIALQEAGWWVRSVLPWVKRNGMPESVTDRPASAIEYVALLTKSERYFYDAEVVRRPASKSTHARVAQNVAGQHGSERAHGGRKTNGPMKAVVRRPKQAKAGSGIRANESYEAVMSGHVLHDRNFRNTDLFFDSLDGPHGLISDEHGPIALDVVPRSFKEAHFATFPPDLVAPLIKAGCPEGGVVLDPFGGSGTTGLVADGLGRDAILIELNPDYCEMARKRIEGAAPLFASVETQRHEPEQLDIEGAR